MNISNRTLAPSLLFLLTACHVQLSEKQSSNQSSPSEPELRDCTAIAIAGLNVFVNVPLMADSRVAVESTHNGETQQLEARLPAEGYRIMENNTLQLGHRISFTGAVERTGEVKVSLLVNGLTQEQKTITLAYDKDGCHPVTQNVTFSVKPNPAWTPDPTFDEYPISDWRVVQIDRKTGAAKISGQNVSYTSTEIIREVIVETTDDRGTSISRQLEKPATMAKSLGRFFESGIDRGPLLNPKSKDNDIREIFAQ